MSTELQCNRTSWLEEFEDKQNNDSDSADGNVIYGVILCLIAAFVLAFSMNVQRYALVAPAENDQIKLKWCCCTLSRNMLWAIGLLFYASANGFYVVGLNFAPLSLMSALFQMALVFNAFLASCILGEKLSRYDIAGDAVILGSVVVCAVFAPTVTVTYSAQDIADLAEDTIGYLFLAVMFSVLIVGMIAVYWFEKKYPDFGTEPDGPDVVRNGSRRFRNRFSIHGTSSGLPGLGGLAAQLIRPNRRMSRAEMQRRQLSKALRVQRRMSITQDGFLAHAMPLNSEQLEDQLKIVPNSYFDEAERKWGAYINDKQRLASSADGEALPEMAEIPEITVEWLNTETESLAAASAVAQPASGDWLADNIRPLSPILRRPRHIERDSIASMDSQWDGTAGEAADAGAQGEGGEGGKAGTGEEVKVFVHVRGGQAVARAGSVGASGRKRRRRSSLFTSVDLSKKSIEQVEAEAESALAEAALEEAKAEEERKRKEEEEAEAEAARDRELSKDEPGVIEASLQDPLKLTQLEGRLRTDSASDTSIGSGTAASPNHEGRGGGGGDATTTPTRGRQAKRPSLKDNELGSSRRHKPKELSVNASDTFVSFRQQLGKGLNLPSDSFKLRSAETGEVIASLDQVEEGLHIILQLDWRSGRAESAADSQTASPQSPRGQMSVRSEQSEASAADDGDDGGDGGDGGASMTDENVVENIRKGKTRPKIPLQKTKSVQPPKMVVACMMVIYPTVLGLVETLVQVSLKAITSLFSFTLACDNQFTHAVAIIMLVLLVISIVLVIVWLRKVYSKFETTECLPIEYGVVMSTSVCSGLAFFQEYRAISTVDLAAMGAAIFSVMIGIAITAYGKED